MGPKASRPLPQKLDAWLRYFDDLGIRSFYRDRVSPAPGPPDSNGELPVPEEVSAAHEDSSSADELSARRAVSAAAAAPSVGPRIASAPALANPAAPLPDALHQLVHPLSLFDAAAARVHESLDVISSDLGDCTRCKLHRQRNKIVFGTGNPRADLVFVGEGPGHDEDVQGLPFVGRAGKLLTQMIEAMGLQRADVYIANIVKCRPPENRQPQEDEISTCMPFLLRQLASIHPKVIVCLGSTAAQALLETKKSISHFRGQWFDFHGAKLIATYHPAYLLRNPNAKPDVWTDLKKAMAVLGLKPPARGQSRA